MTAETLKECFEEHFECKINDCGMKKIHEHYSIFDEDIIQEAFEICMEQYEDAQEAFDKLGGICHNKSCVYVEY